MVFPDISFHSCKSWNGEYDCDTRVIGVMYAGRTLDDKHEDIVYIGINAYWENIQVELPRLPDNMKWNLCADTFAEKPEDINTIINDAYITIGSRSAVVLETVTV